MGRAWQFIGLSAFFAVGFYLAFVYIASWVQIADGIAPARALEINSFSMAVLLPITFTVGWLSDRFGRRPFLLLATILGFFAALPLFWMMHHPSAELAQLRQFGLVLIVGLFAGALPATMIECTPARVRCTAVALGYNMTLGVIGGLSPLVAAWLVERTGDELAPAFLIMATAVISFLVVLLMPETYKARFASAAVTAP